MSVAGNNFYRFPADSKLALFIINKLASINISGSEWFDSSYLWNKITK